MAESRIHCHQALVDWLENQRSSYMVAAAASGVGGQVEVEILEVTDVTETGFKTRGARRLTNPMALEQGLVWAIPPELARAEVVSDAATLIARTYGDRCYVNTGIYPTLFETEPAAWVQKALVDPLLRDYLGHLKSLDRPEAEAAGKYANSLLDAIESDRAVVLSLLPVAGLRLDGRLEANGVVLRPLDAEELADLVEVREQIRFNMRWRPLRRSPSWVSERALLEVQENRPKASQLVHVTRLERIILALQLLSFDPHGEGYSNTFEEPVGIGMRGHPIPMLSHGGWQNITQGDLDMAVDLADRMSPDALVNPTRRQDLALSRFRSAVTEANPTDALIDYVIALELVLLPPRDEGELSFRLSLNGALFQTDDPSRRLRLFDDFRKVYAARSKIVHGGFRVDRADAAAVAAIARQLASGVLLKSLREAWPTEEWFKNSALGIGDGRPVGA